MSLPASDVNGARLDLAGTRTFWLKPPPLAVTRAHSFLVAL